MCFEVGGCYVRRSKGHADASWIDSYAKGEELRDTSKVLLSYTELSKAISISLYPSLQRKAFLTRRWSYLKLTLGKA